MNLKRAISVDEMYKMNFKELEFTGQWLESFGKPEPTGVWLFFGHSGNGKTDFAIKTAKYLCTFKKVAYNTLEEGARLSFQIAIKRNNINLVAKRFVILNEEIADLKARLAKRKSPDIIIIDSFQYCGLTKAEYKDLKEFAIKHKKLIIFISHAEGKEPEGRPARFVKFDADVYAWIEGYEAFVTSRFGGGEPFTIWAESAAEHHRHIK